MVNIIGNGICKKTMEYSSSFAKNGMLAFNGRSASIFRLNTNYSINP